ncbi:MAG TPA: hypothetical protein DEB06_08795 [Phycisphaerales bacterium]|nr:hypothetical protein [Phycisphaerales bacterium]
MSFRYGPVVPAERIELIARGLLAAESRVLLCRNLKHGYFYLPGGHVECSESASDACAREFHEELGWAVRPGPLLLVTEQQFCQNDKERHEVTLVFHVEHSERPPTPSPDPVSREPKIGFEWIELAALPDVDLRPPAVKAWLIAGADSAGLDRPGWIPGAMAGRE